MESTVALKKRIKRGWMNLLVRKIIKENDPHLVIGTGGYASGPLLYVAARKKIPCLIQEQNSFPGITNRILSSYIDKICVAYSGMEKYFPREKIYLTGNPVRAQVLNFQEKRKQAFNFFCLN